MSVPGEPRHDQRIGAALDTLEVPDHGGRFWHELGRRLIAEREAPAAPPFDPVARLASSERRHPTAEPGPEPRRSPARGPAPPPTPDEAGPARPTVTQLAEQAGRVHRGTDWDRWALVALVVAVAGAIAVAALWLGATATTTTRSLTAARVASTISANMNGSVDLVGQVVTASNDGVAETYAFTRSGDGSFRYRELGSRSDTAYDGVAGSARMWRQRTAPDGTATVEAFQDVGLSAGPPDPDGSGRYLAGDAIGRIMRALQSSGRTRARATTFGRHRAWMLDVAETGPPGAPSDHLHVVVDHATLLPLLAVHSALGRATESSLFTQLRSTSSIPLDEFTLSFPLGANVASFDNGFVRVKLPQVAAFTGYEPITPSWLPAGYQLSAVAMQPKARPDLQGTAGGDNPGNVDVVSLLYRRGAERIVVSSRRAGGAQAQWVDPFRVATTPADLAASPRRTRLEGGRFLGSTVEVTDASTLPHLWGRNDDFVFTVAGDLNPSGLLRVAESLT